MTRMRATVTGVLGVALLGSWVACTSETTQSATCTGTATGAAGEAGAGGGSGLGGQGGQSASGGGDEGGSLPDTVCGNGVLETGEGCDDGNHTTTDACPDGPHGTCLVAACGDGYLLVGTEGCDDGNGVLTDDCPDGPDGTCEPAACGDGLVWDSHEGCDDGNGIDTDDCPDGAAAICQPAACNDGVRWSGHEQCDDGNGADGDGCSLGCVVECPNGDKRGSDFHCYRLFTNDLSWDDARAACQALGAGWDLAAVSSDGERDFVDGTVDAGDCWIGGSDVQTEGTFVWSNGEAWTWDDWGDGEPNGSTSENCVQYVDNSLADDNDEMNDLACSSTLDYLCELTPAGE